MTNGAQEGTGAGQERGQEQGQSQGWWGSGAAGAQDPGTGTPSLSGRGSRLWSCSGGGGGGGRPEHRILGRDPDLGQTGGQQRAAVPPTAGWGGVQAARSGQDRAADQHGGVCYLP